MFHGMLFTRGSVHPYSFGTTIFSVIFWYGLCPSDPFIRQTPSHLVAPRFRFITSRICFIATILMKPHLTIRYVWWTTATEFVLRRFVLGGPSSPFCSPFFLNITILIASHFGDDQVVFGSFRWQGWSSTCFHPLDGQTFVSSTPRMSVFGFCAGTTRSVPYDCMYPQIYRMGMQ